MVGGFGAGIVILGVGLLLAFARPAAASPASPPVLAALSQAGHPGVGALRAPVSHAVAAAVDQTSPAIPAAAPMAPLPPVTPPTDAIVRKVEPPIAGTVRRATPLADSVARFLPVRRIAAGAVAAASQPSLSAAPYSSGPAPASESERQAPMSVFGAAGAAPAGWSERPTPKSSAPALSVLVAFDQVPVPTQPSSAPTPLTPIPGPSESSSPGQGNGAFEALPAAGVLLSRPVAMGSLVSDGLDPRPAFAKRYSPPG